MQIDADTLARLSQYAPEGFGGTFTEVHTVHTPGHALHVVTCTFDDASTEVYLVPEDTHEGGGRPRLLALSTAIHVLQNLGDAEVWNVENRHGE